MEQIPDSKSRKTRPREEKRGLTEVIKQQFLFQVQCRPSGEKRKSERRCFCDSYDEEGLSEMRKCHKMSQNMLETGLDPAQVTVTSDTKEVN